MHRLPGRPIKVGPYNQGGNGASDLFGSLPRQRPHPPALLSASPGGNGAETGGGGGRQPLCRSGTGRGRPQPCGAGRERAAGRASAGPPPACGGSWRSGFVRPLATSLQIFVCLWSPQRQMCREGLPGRSVPSLGGSWEAWEGRGRGGGLPPPRCRHGAPLCARGRFPARAAGPAAVCLGGRGALGAPGRQARGSEDGGHASSRAGA